MAYQRQTFLIPQPVPSAPKYLKPRPGYKSDNRTVNRDKNINSILAYVERIRGEPITNKLEMRTTTKGICWLHR